MDALKCNYFSTEQYSSWPLIDLWPYSILLWQRRIVEGQRVTAVRPTEPKIVNFDRNEISLNPLQSCFAWPS